MSLRKSSRRRNGSKSEVLPKPNARRRCTPAPSSAGLALTSRLTGRRDILTSNKRVYSVEGASANARNEPLGVWLKLPISRNVETPTARLIHYAPSHRVKLGG